MSASSARARAALLWLALLAGAALAAAGAAGELRLHDRRAGEESAVRRERERLRDAWIASTERAVDEVMDGRGTDLGARMDVANAAWKRGVEAAAEREGRDFEAYVGERRWTLLALFGGVAVALAAIAGLALAWLRPLPPAAAPPAP